MARAQARARQQQDLPAHEEPGDGEADIREDVRNDSGGMTVDMGDLTDRQSKKGGEDRDDDTQEESGGLERERIRDERRDERASRREKKNAEKEAERLRAELEDANRRLEEVEARQQRGEQVDLATQIQTLESSMERLQGQYREALAIKERAFKDRDNPESASAIVKADEAALAAREEFARLEAQRLRLIDGARRAAAAPRITPTLQREAKAFMEDHPWYDGSGRDADSRRVLELDKKLARRMDPNDPDYWEELREMVKAELPHRFEEDDDRDRGAQTRSTERQSTRRTITSGGGRESSGGGGRGSNSFYLSPARVAALKEAGLYDLDESGRPGPKLSKMIRRYKAADEAEARRRGR